MSVRKRTWNSPNGEMKEAWVVDYFDQHGRRHLKTFARKRDADSYHAQVAIDVRAGTHTADSASISVEQAGELWLQDRTAAGLEATTLVAYRIYVNRHITPRIGTLKLSQLTVPAARTFEDQLRIDCSSGVVRAARGHNSECAAAAPPSSVMNWRRLRSSMGSPPEPAVPAYRRLRMPRKHPQVLGVDLNCSD